MTLSVNKNNVASLAQESGIQLIKAGTYKLNQLAGLLEVNNLKSQMAEVNVTDNANGLTVGFFAMQPGVDFEFTYEFVEYKVITKGKIVMRDLQGNKYVAEVGDILLFTPNVTVIFDGESDGEAVYTAHRSADNMFAPK
ncbi:hypothetical protein [Psychrobacter sp. PAMC 21119]|jgi:uncharacterized cupin superfamily protein|uniref:hypothetical protein n=1 Tax=Psychrobacter sp. PAMC 21119 TaxID=1112209 RepID=UPI000287D064|nr:hypothetical protein [Psychrobacter sp. PAMC 21119]